MTDDANVPAAADSDVEKGGTGDVVNVEDTVKSETVKAPTPVPTTDPDVGLSQADIPKLREGEQFIDR